MWRINQKTGKPNQHMARHDKYSKCDKAITNICHCVWVDGADFYVCCGWYCHTCCGRVNDMAKIRKHLHSSDR